MLEDISDEEYDRYIENLKKKSPMKMDYSELTDLADHVLDKATRAQDWGGVRQGIRLLVLAMNFNAGAAHAAKQGVIALARKMKVSDLINQQQIRDEVHE